MSHLQQARALEEANNLFDAAKHYALAWDQDEAANAQEAIRAALTFFEAKDNLPGRIAEDEYLYFDRWIARAEEVGAGPDATYWKTYDAMIYGDGPEFVDAARGLYDQGCRDALLTLALHFPDEFGEAATAFAEKVSPKRTYRERYLYSILGHRFDTVA